MTYISNEEVLKAVYELKEIVLQMAKKEVVSDIDEVSKHQACKMLNRSYEGLNKLIKKGQLKAIKYGRRERFRISDIKAMQEMLSRPRQRPHYEGESSESVCNRIFNS